jgi:hypothetical protein
MKRFVRSEWIVAALVALCGLAAVATLRATAQQLSAPPGAPPSAASPATPAGAPAREVPAPAAPPANTPPASPPPAGAAPANREDATVAPDKGQSADNNVSFPVDI